MAIFPHRHKNYEWWILGLIMLVAFVFRFQHIQSIPPGLYPDEAMNGNNAIQALETGEYKIFYPDNNGREGLFINIQAQSLRLFGYHPWALRVVSALFGLLTVLGTYLLTKRLFSWQIAAFSSFLLAVSFWHTVFSRIGFRAIMAPMLFVWGMYFLWRGKLSLKLFDFAVSGILIGLGAYTYIAYRSMPIVVLFVFIAYWRGITHRFSHDKYIHVRNKLISGFAMLMIASFIVALPILWYFLVHPDDFLGRTAQISIFSSDAPLQMLLTNLGSTLGGFIIEGDHNWRHNIDGKPLLFWPVGVLFVIGFIRSWVKLFKTKHSHGHPPDLIVVRAGHSSVQVFLLSWFILGLLPVVLSNEGLPHALRAILVAPVVFIFAGEGLWWLYDLSHKWYGVYDTDDVVVHGHRAHESKVIAAFAVCALLSAIMLSEYKSYFVAWANNPNVAAAFSSDYVALGEMLNHMPQEVKKYVVVNADGALVLSPDGTQSLPMPVQTVMFLTDTWTPQKQRAKNLYYLTENQYTKRQYQTVDSIVLPLHEVQQ